MSSKCRYVYVQGLRFSPEDVSVVWVADDGSERLVSLRKSSSGRAVWGPDGVPLVLTPRELRKHVKSGETIKVEVWTRSLDGGNLRSPVRLDLDPRRAEERRGRRSFSVDALRDLTFEQCRQLAFEQLRTAPYGRENAREAFKRLRWSVEHLNDSQIASMLRLLPPGQGKGSALDAASPELRMDLERAERSRRRLERSSTPDELGALLLSDKEIFEGLLARGHRESVGLLQGLDAVSRALLAVPQEGPTFQGRVREALDPSSSVSVRAAAVEFFNDHDGLRRLAFFDAEPGVQARAVARLRDPADLEALVAGMVPAPDTVDEGEGGGLIPGLEDLGPVKFADTMAERGYAPSDRRVHPSVLLAALQNPAMPLGPLMDLAHRSEDPAVLMHIAYSGHATARLVALDRIEDPGFLDSLARDASAASDVRGWAAVRLKDQALLAALVHDDSLPSSVRASAVSAIADDPGLLARIASADPTASVRRVAVSRVDDPDVLQRVFRGDDDVSVRHAALTRMVERGQASESLLRSVATGRSSYTEQERASAAMASRDAQTLSGLLTGEPRRQVREAALKAAGIVLASEQPLRSAGRETVSALRTAEIAARELHAEASGSGGEVRGRLVASKETWAKLDAAEDRRDRQALRDAVLHTAMTDPNPQVASHAVQVLTTAVGGDVVEDLGRVARTSAHVHARLDAAIALVEHVGSRLEQATLREAASALRTAEIAARELQAEASGSGGEVRGRLVASKETWAKLDAASDQSSGFGSVAPQGENPGDTSTGSGVEAESVLEVARAKEQLQRVLAGEPDAGARRRVLERLDALSAYKMSSSSTDEAGDEVSIVTVADEAFTAALTGDGDVDVRVYAASRSRDREALTAAARKDASHEVRIAALSRLDSQRVFADAALYDPSPRVRLHAIPFLVTYDSGRNPLETIEKTDSDPQVREAARVARERFTSPEFRRANNMTRWA